MEKIIDVLRKIPKFKDLPEEELKKKAKALPLLAILGLVAVGYTIYNINKQNAGEGSEENVSIEAPRPLIKQKTLSEAVENQNSQQQEAKSNLATQIPEKQQATQTGQTQIISQSPQSQQQIQQPPLNQPKQQQQELRQQTSSNLQTQATSSSNVIKVDLVKGLPSDIVRLDYEIEKLEKQKKLVELKKQIEELEGKKTVSGRGQIQELPDVAILKQELQRMKLEQERMFQEKVKKDITPADESGQMNFIIKSIYCINKNECNGVVADKTGEYLVRAGSRLPSGLFVESINPDGIYFSSSSGRFFRPVDMSLEPQQKDVKGQKSSSTITGGQSQSSGTQTQAKPVMNIQRPVEGR